MDERLKGEVRGRGKEEEVLRSRLKSDSASVRKTARLEDRFPCWKSVDAVLDGASRPRGEGGRSASEKEVGKGEGKEARAHQKLDFSSFDPLEDDLDFVGRWEKPIEGIQPIRNGCLKAKTKKSEAEGGSWVEGTGKRSSFSRRAEAQHFSLCLLALFSFPFSHIPKSKLKNLQSSSLINSANSLASSSVIPPSNNPPSSLSSAFFSSSGGGINRSAQRNPVTLSSASSYTLFERKRDRVFTRQPPPPDGSIQPRTNDPFLLLALLLPHPSPQSHHLRAVTLDFPNHPSGGLSLREVPDSDVLV